MAVQLTRRTFLARLASAAALGAGSIGIASAAGIGPTAGGQAVGLPVTEDRRRAVVIGTGFGGAISALRLARAGVPVLMLEFVSEIRDRIQG